MSDIYSDYIGRVLMVIYQHLAETPEASFTKDDLTAWCADIASFRVTTITMGLAVKLGYLKKPAGQPRQAAGVNLTYLITPEGIDAAKKAIVQAKKQAKKQLKDQERSDRAARFEKRVWDLFRIRQQMTAQSAAETLVDVGTPITSTKAKVAACLRAWSKAQPDAVQISKYLIDGQKRYVLVRDLGLQPPTAQVQQAKKRRGKL